MFVIGGIVETRGQHNNGRVPLAVGRRDGTQAGQQRLGIIVDRGNPVATGEFGQQPQHHLPVFQHIGDPGGGAGIVLQHKKFIRPGSDNVDARNMGIDTVGWRSIDHCKAEAGIAQHQFLWNDARPDDLPLAVDIAQKRVERFDPLNQSAFKAGPFPARNHPGDDVERDQPLTAADIAVDRKGDPDPPEEQFGLGAAGLQ